MTSQCTPDATARRIARLRSVLADPGASWNPDAGFMPWVNELLSAVPLLIAVAEAAAASREVDQRRGMTQREWMAEHTAAVDRLDAALRALGESAVREEPR